MDENKKVPITFRVFPNIKKQFAELCKKLDTNMNAALTFLLNDFIENSGTTPSKHKKIEKLQRKIEKLWAKLKTYV